MGGECIVILRRRMMVESGGVAPLPTPLYELEEPTSTANYNTGVKLFDPAISFTILCEAYFTNRTWYNRHSIVALADDQQFRICGYAQSFNGYVNGAVAETSNYYSAFVMNNLTSDTDKKKCGSIFARFPNTTKQTRRFAARFNATTLLAEGFSEHAASYHAPTIRWWYLNSNISSTNTIKLNANGATNSPRVDIFRVYNSLLTDDQINAFLDGVID